MKTFVKLAGIALGGATLFAGAFVASVRMRGAPAHELPAIGRFFPEPEPEDEETESGESDETHGAPRALHPTGTEPVVAARLGVFDIFRLDAPFSEAALAELVTELKDKHAEANRRMADIADKESRVAERLRSVDEQHQSLQEIRTQLENWERELRSREQTVQGAESAHAAREEGRWSILGKLFAEGDAEELAPRLLSYTPDDAARVLQTVGESRARTLLDALPTSKWNAYAEAFSRASALPAESTSVGTQDRR